MQNVIEFPVIPRKTHSFTAHLVRDVCELPALDQLYVCPSCGHRIETRKLWVDALIDCRCGARMEAK